MVEVIATGIGPCQHQASRRPPGMTNKEFFAALGLQLMKDTGVLPRGYKQIRDTGNDGFVITKTDGVSTHGSEEHTQTKQEETGNKEEKKDTSSDFFQSEEYEDIHTQYTDDYKIQTEIYEIPDAAKRWQDEMGLFSYITTEEKTEIKENMYMMGRQTNTNERRYSSEKTSNHDYNTRPNTGIRDWQYRPYIGHDYQTRERVDHRYRFGCFQTPSLYRGKLTPEIIYQAKPEPSEDHPNHVTPYGAPTRDDNAWQQRECQPRSEEWTEGLTMEHVIQMNTEGTTKIYDATAGGGFGSIAAILQGGKIMGYSEVDPEMNTIMQYITGKESLGDAFKGMKPLGVDIYLSGFPCHGYSILNKAVNISKAENWKYIEQAVIILIMCPRAIII